MDTNIWYLLMLNFVFGFRFSFLIVCLTKKWSICDFALSLNTCDFDSIMLFLEVTNCKNFKCYFCLYLFQVQVKQGKCKGDKGSYRCEFYTEVVSFSTCEDEKNYWIDAMPNNRSIFLKLKKIFACANHFECKWKAVKSENWPSQPISILTKVSSL